MTFLLDKEILYKNGKYEKIDFPESSLLSAQRRIKEKVKKKKKTERGRDFELG